MARKKKEVEKIEYVGIHNPAMLQLNMRKMSKIYTDYARLILEIKELRDKKQKKKETLRKKLKEVREEFEKLVKMLPELPREKIIEKEKRLKDIEAPYKAVSTFDELRAEFERLRRELEKI